MNLKLSPIASAVILALYGCASNPPLPPQPNMRANASMPSCVAFCEVSVTTEFAQEEISVTMPVNVNVVPGDVMVAMQDSYASVDELPKRAGRVASRLPS